jgi:hypothetical protein
MEPLFRAGVYRWRLKHTKDYAALLQIRQKRLGGGAHAAAAARSDDDDGDDDDSAFLRSVTNDTSQVHEMRAVAMLQEVFGHMERGLAMVSAAAENVPAQRLAPSCERVFGIFPTPANCLSLNALATILRRAARSGTTRLRLRRCCS